MATKVARLQITRAIEQGDLNPVGMIVASMLTEAQFQALNGTSWVLAYGQSIAGSTYATVTGNTTAPDLRGRTVAGKDNMGGSAASRLTTGGSGVDGATLGAAGGAQSHTLDNTQIPSHRHSFTWGNVAGANNVLNSGSIYNGQGLTVNADNSVGFTGGGQAHNNTQPTLVVNYFIKIN